MKNYFLFTILFILGSSSFVKSQNVTIATSNRSSLSYNVSEKAANTNYSDIKGSPYTSIDFQEATRAGEDEVVLVRYDAYKQILLFKDQNGNLKAASPFSKERFDLKDKNCSYVVISYPESGLGYGLLLWENSNGMRLIKRQVVKYNEAKEADGAYKVAVPASFGDIDETFFIQFKENGKIIELPSQKKKAFKLLGTDFENKAKKNKLNVKDEEELIQLLKLTFGNSK